jgi:hypothetical protein
MINIIKGSASICSSEAFYVGTDYTYNFGKTLQLSDGKPVKVDLYDLIFLVQIIKQEPFTGSKAEIVHLPSSLFQQAQKNNMVYFNRNDINTEFELELQPMIQYNLIQLQEGPCVKESQIAFDDYARAISSSQIKKGFLSFEDIPSEVPAIYLHSLKASESIQKESDSLTRDPNGDEFHTFSPETKRILIGQTGTQPFNPDDLALFDFKASRDIRDTISKRPIVSATGLTLDLDACGCKLDQMEMLLDQGNLYVMMDRRGLYQRELEDSQVFYHAVLGNFLIGNQKQFDEKEIIATLRNDGVLTIYFPFETISSSPAKKIIDCTVSLDVGFGNMLGICCAPSWGEKPIVFKYVDSKGWQGEIPLEKSFKFVKIDSNSGQVIAWETGPDRRCDESFYDVMDGSMHLDSDVIKFT